MENLTLKDFTFSFITREEFLSFYSELRPKVFAENNDVNSADYWSEEEIAKNKDLTSKFKTEVRSYLVCKYQDQVAGWSFGYQKDGEEFYMVNSAVIPEFRNKGIYNHLLSMIVEKAKSEGFQIVSSIHHASNNAIIIPKLKYGFKISGMKINPRFGTLIELHYFTNEKINKIMDYRTGERKHLPV